MKSRCQLGPRQKFQNLTQMHPFSLLLLKHQYQIDQTRYLRNLQSTTSSQPNRAKPSAGGVKRQIPLPQRENQKTRSPVQQGTPAGQEQMKQRSAPRPKVQLEPPPTHNRYQALEDMDTGDRGPPKSKSSKNKPNR